MTTLKDHRLVPANGFSHILYERRPAKDPRGEVVPDLFDAWIWLNNPQQLNSYTTDALRELILAFRDASTDRAVVSVVLTAVGDRAFCSGGNTKEYAEYYAGHPLFPAARTAIPTSSARVIPLSRGAGRSTLLPSVVLQIGTPA